MRVECLTQVIHETKITSLEEVTKALVGTIPRQIPHESNKRAQGRVEDKAQSQSDTETKKTEK